MFAMSSKSSKHGLQHLEWADKGLVCNDGGDRTLDLRDFGEELHVLLERREFARLDRAVLRPLLICKCLNH